MRIAAGRARPIRLGRGLAPLELELPAELPEAVLAVGGHLKLTVALAWGRRVVVSPHVGDMGTRRSEQVFEQVAHDLQRLYEACHDRGADVAVGSRYTTGGRVENWPLDRNLLSKSAAIYTRMITWMPVKDPTAGFVCYRREVLETINLDKVRFVGYAFQIEMKFAAWKLGFRIEEVPIVFTDRKLGVSKMNKGIIKEGIFGVISIQWQSLFKSYRQRVAQSAG